MPGAACLPGAQPFVGVGPGGRHDRMVEFDLFDGFRVVRAQPVEGLAVKEALPCQAVERVQLLTVARAGPVDLPPCVDRCLVAVFGAGQFCLDACPLAHVVGLGDELSGLFGASGQSGGHRCREQDSAVGGLLLARIPLRRRPSDRPRLVGIASR